jgi:uncharacterized BrkB/YihY/UPF0761 family membrane protein
VISTFWRRLREAAAGFGADKAARMAAALSYSTLFSLVPLLFVAVAVTVTVYGPSTNALPADCSTATAAAVGTSTG